MKTGVHLEPQRHNSEALTYIGYVLAKIAERMGVEIEPELPTLPDNWVFEMAANYHWATTPRVRRSDPDRIIEALTGNFKSHE